ncbi:hypothetical protein U4V42_15505 [Salmonella enterica subsp. enterica serovar Typhi]|nr:hypothetical protein U4V42_15505 [Salmonella enterica subsp. enterica serovar Typhi]
MLDMSRHQHTTINPSSDCTPTGEVLNEQGFEFILRCAAPFGVASENGIYGHSRFCNTDFDDKLACLNLSGV